MVTVWRMRTELGMEIARRIYLYLVQKYPQGIFFYTNYQSYQGQTRVFSCAYFQVIAITPTPSALLVR